MASFPPGGLFQRPLCPQGSPSNRGLHSFLRASNKAPRLPESLLNACGHCPEGCSGSPSTGSEWAQRASPVLPAQPGCPATSQGWPGLAGLRNGLPWGQLFHNSPWGFLGSGQGQRKNRRPCWHAGNDSLGLRLFPTPRGTDQSFGEFFLQLGNL